LDVERPDSDMGRGFRSGYRELDPEVGDLIRSFVFLNVKYKNVANEIIQITNID
jgi:hypothetical protein